MSRPRRGRCHPLPIAVPAAGPARHSRRSSPKRMGRAHVPQQDLTPLRRGIGSPAPFRLFILVRSLAEAMLMGAGTVPGGEPHALFPESEAGRGVGCLLGREARAPQVGLGSSRL